MEFECTRNGFKKYQKFYIEGILYLILLIIYINFYLIGEVQNYMKESTALSSRTEKVEFLEAPHMTLCFQPSFKPSTLQKYGLPEYMEHFKDLYKALKLKGMDMDMEMYENFGYKYGEDFDITLTKLKFTNGTKLYESISFHIQKVVTFRNGLCYSIKHNVTLSTTDAKMNLHFSYKGLESDIPESAKLLLSSSRGWHGIIIDDWPLFDPAILTIPIEKLHSQKMTRAVSVRILAVSDETKS